MAEFLFPEKAPAATFTLFALSASYTEDVIEGKHEYENLETAEIPDKDTVRRVLDFLCRAPQLLPLTREEINEILGKIQDFHGRAYDWEPKLPVSALLEATQSGGYLLRTKIRAAIEFLDQLYQYGRAGKTVINELGRKICRRKCRPWRSWRKIYRKEVSSQRAVLRRSDKGEESPLSDQKSHIRFHARFVSKE